MNRSSKRPELLVPLARHQHLPMHQQILQALREAIRARRLQPGGAVPSTRTLAADLGVSRGVVVQAYDQLIAEGYLISTPRAPTRVSGSVRAPTPEPAEPESQRFEFDFRPGEPDLRAFPREAWRRSFREALESIEPGQLGYNDPEGSHPASIGDGRLSVPRARRGVHAESDRRLHGMRTGAECGRARASKPGCQPRRPGIARSSGDTAHHRGSGPRDRTGAGR